jgi:hypothetical protein
LSDIDRSNRPAPWASSSAAWVAATVRKPLPPLDAQRDAGDVFGQISVTSSHRT